MSWRLRSIAAGALHLPPAERSTLIVLADCADDRGVCWPSLRYIADVGQLSLASVKRSIASLNRRGVLVTTGKRRMGRAVRQVVETRLCELDRLRRKLTHKPPQGSPMSPYGSSPMSQGLTHEPDGSSPAIPPRLTSDTPGGSPMSPRDDIYKPHHDPHHPPKPRAHGIEAPDSDQGEGEPGPFKLLIGKLTAKAVAGWTPTRSDRTALAALTRDVDASRLLRLAEQMPGYRTHPVSALVSLVERPERASRPVDELGVGGAAPIEAEPMPDRGEAQAALADAIAQTITDPMAMSTRQADMVWDRVREALAEQLAPKTFEALVQPLAHLITVSRPGKAVEVHLDGDPFVIESLRARYPAEELDALASSITPPRSRHIRLHSAGLEGQRA